MYKYELTHRWIDFEFLSTFVEGIPDANKMGVDFRSRGIQPRIAYW